MCERQYSRKLPIALGAFTSPTSAFGCSAPRKNCECNTSQAALGIVTMCERQYSGKLSIALGAGGGGAFTSPTSALEAPAGSSRAPASVSSLLPSVGNVPLLGLTDSMPASFGNWAYNASQAGAGTVTMCSGRFPWKAWSGLACSRTRASVACSLERFTGSSWTSASMCGVLVSAGSVPALGLTD